MVLLGDSHVGKSSLVTRFAEGYYRDSSRPPTISATFVSKTIPTSHGISTKVQIWDTAGSAAFRAASSTFVEGSDAVIICYDVSNRESLAGMKVRLDEMLLHRRNSRRGEEKQQRQQHHRQFGIGGSRKQDGDIVVAIAGLKADLASSSTATSSPSVPCSPPSSPTRRTQRQRNNTTFVPDYEVERLAETLGVLHFPTSAKTGQNVHELFTNIADRVLQSRLEEDNDREYLAQNPSAAVGGTNFNVGGIMQKDGEAISPRILFDKYYVNETSTDENDNGGSENKSKSEMPIVDMSHGGVGTGGRVTPTKTSQNNSILAGTPNSKRSTDDREIRGGREATPERRRRKNDKRKEKARKKKQRRSKEKYRDESSSSSSSSEDDDEERDKGTKREEEKGGGGGGFCAADEPFACQSVACGAGGEDGTSCIVQ